MNERIDKLLDDRPPDDPPAPNDQETPPSPNNKRSNQAIDENANERDSVGSDTDYWCDPNILCNSLERFSQHVLGLEVICVRDGQAFEVIFTTWVFDLVGTLGLITAGHVVEELKKLLADPTVEIARIHLLDHYNTTGAEAIPLDASLLDFYSIDDQNHDFGTIELPEWYARTLRANPTVEPLKLPIFHGCADTNPDAYFLVGFPQEWVKSTISLMGDKLVLNHKSTLACIPVALIEDRALQHPSGFWGHSDAFYAEVLPCRDGQYGDLDSILGTSGGPIFGVYKKPNGDVRYGIYGVQSAWLPDKRILRATGVERIASAFERYEREQSA